jgi:hypothetical protein
MRMRTLNKLYAAVAGYFWVACPLCNQYFGGHEWRGIHGHSSTVRNSSGVSESGICPDCTRAGRGDA